MCITRNIFIILVTGILTLNSGVNAACATDDPCNSTVYVALNEPSRSTGYTTMMGAGEQNDTGLETNWYRGISDAGGDMPTSPVSTGQCNAWAPIWLNGSLPDEADGMVEIDACASAVNDSCIREYTVSVKNCGDFNVYCLLNTYHTFDRYCFGSEVECASNETSPTGFTPNCTLMVLDAETNGTMNFSTSSMHTRNIETTEYSTSNDYNATMDMMNVTMVETDNNATTSSIVSNVTLADTGATTADGHTTMRDPVTTFESTVCGTNVDPCSSDVYIELNDPTRSTSYNVRTAANHDMELSTGWYRSVSEAGSDMPTSPAVSGQCDAYAPLWINGSLPGTSDGTVELTACVAFLEDACARQYMVPVRHCGDFSVYCLTPTNDTFDRYCFGSESVCADGLSSSNGYTPDCEAADDSDKKKNRHKFKALETFVYIGFAVNCVLFCGSVALLIFFVCYMRQSAQIGDKDKLQKQSLDQGESSAINNRTEPDTATHGPHAEQHAYPEPESHTNMDRNVESEAHANVYDNAENGSGDNVHGHARQDSQSTLPIPSPAHYENEQAALSHRINKTSKPRPGKLPPLPPLY